jgi:uncharacterized protein YdhG (YjbR/CyaY superfamily)
MTKGKFKSIDEYIDAQPAAIQPALRRLRAAIARTAPDATEKISYGMPTFFLKGNLVHFAAFENHIGFYPTPSGVTAFENELNGLKYAKGSIQFPLEKPVPLPLIREIVKFRLAETLKKAGSRK